MKQITKDDLLKLTHKQQVQFAIFCAEQVFHLNSDKTRDKARKAIDTAKLWLEGRASQEECRAAAYAAAYATAAYAAAYAAYAAAYAAAAYAAADAAAANTAADAAAAAEDKQTIVEEQWDYYDNLLNLDKYAEEMINESI